jgi:hypothetical protein
MSDVNVLVKVQRDGEDIESVADRLAKRGLKVGSKLPLTGVISGTIERSKMESLRKVPGVTHVREEGRFQVPPLDEDVPQ